MEVQKLRILAILVVILLCTFAGSSYVSRKKTQQVLAGDEGQEHSSSLHAYMEEAFWNHCGMDLINMNKAIEGLEQCKPGEPNCAIQKFDTETIRKATKYLHPSMKKSLRDCILRKNLPVLVSGNEAQSDNRYLKYLESILYASDVPRQILASEPDVSPSAPPSTAPSTRIPSTAPSTHIPPSIPPSVLLFPPSKGPSVQTTPTGEAPTSSKPGPGKRISTRKAVAIAVGVTIPATMLITALVMVCIFMFCRGRKNDKRKQLAFVPDLSSGDKSNGRVADQTNNVSSADGDLYPHHQFSGDINSQHSVFRSDGSIVPKISAETHVTFTGIADDTDALPPRPPMAGPISVADQSPGAPPAPVVVNAAPKPPSPPTPPPPASPPKPPGPPPPPLPMIKPVTAAPKPPGPPPSPPPPTMKPDTAAPKPPGPPPPPPMLKPVTAAAKPPTAPPKPPAGPSGPRPPPPPRSGAAPPRPPPSTTSRPRPPLAPSHSDGQDSKLSSAPKAKLKPFFWETANPNNKSMVWNQIKAGSFQFNEEQMVTLFSSAPVDSNKNERKSESVAKDPPVQYIKLIDSKKAQNISILLKAINLTTEEVCDALLEGCEVPSELFQTLLKMAPTQEEEVKLRSFSGDILLLGPAERFLKALVDIPFAFKRIECLIFATSIQEEVSSTKQSFATLEVACKELRSSRLFLKLLEAVLKTGNRMNDGTFRGGAQAFKLDTLLKLADVKGTDGKTTLLHFVVQEIIRSEGIRAARASRESESSSSINLENNAEAIADNTEDNLRRLGLEVVSHLSSELENVKKAAALDADSLTMSVTRLRNSLNKTRAFLESDVKSMTEESGFLETLQNFVQNAEVDIESLVEEEKRIMASVRSVESYFHGSSGKDEGLRLFGIVRDFLIMVDKICKEVKMSQSKPVVTTKGASASSASSITSDQTHQEPAAVLDMRQRLFPAIADRRADTSSSDDDA